MKNIYLGLKFSFSYFSIFPIRFKQTDDLNNQDILKYAILFFPFVGFILACFIVLIYQTLNPSIYLALICSIIYMVLYGFLHTEAIADVVDAIYAAHSGKDPYEVIKEPTVGAMGLLYTTSFVILKIASLCYILYMQLFAEFIVFAVLSRVMILLIIKLNNFKSSFVNIIKSNLTKIDITIAVITYLLLCYFIINTNIFSFLLISLIFSYLLIKTINTKIGFLNGDILGFNLELNELLLMIIILLYLN